MEFKAVVTPISEIDERTIVGYSAIFGNIDSGHDRIFYGAFKKTLKENVDRVRHLWQHDRWSPPIASILSLKEVRSDQLPEEVPEKYPGVTGGLQVTRRYLETARGNEVLAAVKSKAIREMSFAYDAVKYDFEEVEIEIVGEDEEEVQKRKMLIRNLREIRLWDTSDVNWGMNALTIANAKTAVPYRDQGIASEDTPWSGPTLSNFTDGTFEELTAAERRRIMAHFTWSANVPPETYGDLKLPHHKAGASGVGAAVWNGVRAAMGALMGARGGLNIPDADRRSVYNHLVGHYKQFDKEPPDFKVIEFVQWSDEFLSDETLSEILAMRKLKDQEVDEVVSLISKLKTIFMSAEPQSPDETQEGKALTAKMLRRLEMMSHNPILYR